MSASKSIEDILHQVNQTLAPGERVSPDQIRDVGHQLDNLLHEAQGPEWQAETAPVPELNLKQRLQRELTSKEHDLMEVRSKVK